MKKTFFDTNTHLIVDGAMGTMIQSLGLGAEAFGGPSFKMLLDILCVTRPEEIKKIHRAYLEAGVNAVETNGFGASALRLEEFDFKKFNTSALAINLPIDITRATKSEIAYHVSVQAARIARAAIEEYKTSKSYDKRPLYVFGCVGPSNCFLTSSRAQLKHVSYEQIVDNSCEQALGLIDGGVDAFTLETHQDPLELKAIIHGVQRAQLERKVKRPIFVHVTVDAFSRMPIFHTHILAAYATVEGTGIDAFGINCSTGPAEMESTVRCLSENSRLPISVLPNAGLPVNQNGKLVYNLTPQEFAGYLKRFVEDYGVQMVGGCCGTTPGHLRAAVAELRGLKGHKGHKGHKGQNGEGKGKIFVSGPQKAVLLDSSQGLIRIGERLNVRGSKKVRDAVENSKPIDFATLEAVAGEQVNELGLEIIDVCMDSNVVNTQETLVSVIKEITTDFNGVMCIDSFSPQNFKSALEAYPGRAIINSISLETLDAVVPQLKPHDPVYICLCVDRHGPAQTSADKVKIAKEIVKRCASYGVAANHLIIDVNAFPIGSEPNDKINFALESLNAIKRIKTIDPTIKVSIGVGNLTNGLSKKSYMRKVITSVFLDLARTEGLDAAIINPEHFVPIVSLEPEHVSFAKKIILDHDMEAFAELESIAESRGGKAIVQKTNYESLSPADAVATKIKDGFKQQSIIPDVEAALKTIEPLDLINRYLMPSMQALGEGFGRGEVSLPHLLKSADIMKAAMSYIETLLKSKRQGVKSKGTIVLGTVYQDVHSIGMDLVKTLLENYGFTIIDLGVQVPADKFVEAVKEHKAAAVALSALLVQTANHMVDVAKGLREAELGTVAILVGGAPINWQHAARVSLWGQNDSDQMIPSVFYCQSGMDCVNVMNRWMESGDAREQLMRENRKHLLEQVQTRRQESGDRSQEDGLNIESVLRNCGSLKERVVEISLKEFLPMIDRRKLFSLNWKYGGESTWAKKGITEAKLEKQLVEWVARCEKERWIQPQAVYGIGPISPMGPIGLMVSTAGPKVEAVFKELEAQGNVEGAFLFKGLADRVAEDLAEHVHGLMRKEMHLAPNQGRRYSPGYPAIPDLKVNCKIAELLKAKKHLGVEVTEAGQFVPTSTTGAVVMGAINN